MRPSPTVIAITLPPVLMLVSSCVAPKAVVVAEEQAATPQTAAVEPTPVEAPPAMPAVPDDGIRLPDMLALPGDSEFKRPPAANTPAGSSGAVIARPPVNPPTDR